MKHDSKYWYEIRLKTPLRTFEAENAQKIRTSRLGEKDGVLIEKKSVLSALDYDPRFFALKFSTEIRLYSNQLYPGMWKRWILMPLPPPPLP